ncbi:MAG: hypothetical protein GY729_12585 [Desulfobacteraceae bacterium]|nr:hypothetical protein [Desulfobacteraceae bacterium]
MKTVKWAFWVIVLVALALLIYQNQGFFLAKQSLNYDLKISNWNWATPEIQNVGYWGICFLIGYLLAGFKWMVTRFKANKAFKGLNASLNAKNEKIDDLINELNFYKNDPYMKKVKASAGALKTTDAPVSEENKIAGKEEQPQEKIPSADKDETQTATD